MDFLRIRPLDLHVGTPQMLPPIDVSRIDDLHLPTEFAALWTRPTDVDSKLREFYGRGWSRGRLTSELMTREFLLDPGTFVWWKHARGGGFHLLAEVFLRSIVPGEWTSPADMPLERLVEIL